MDINLIFQTFRNDLMSGCRGRGGGKRRAGDGEDI
jgi:hypothetical protein